MLRTWYMFHETLSVQTALHHSGGTRPITWPWQQKKVRDFEGIALHFVDLELRVSNLHFRSLRLPRK